MNKKIRKVVLAYSGGLDTSVALRWLKEKYGCEVVAGKPQVVAWGPMVFRRWLRSFLKFSVCP